MYHCEKRITFKNAILIYSMKCFGGNTTSVYRFLKSYDSISKMLESQVPLKRCNLIVVVLWDSALRLEVFFRWKMLFCHQNCSDLLWEEIVLMTEKNFWNSRLKAEICKIFEISGTNYSNSKRSEHILVTEHFF